VEANPNNASGPWPALPLEAWRDTCATLHLWTQIVGKLQLALSPPLNHWWHVPLSLTARGLTTSPLPYGRRFIQLTFDFIEHALLLQDSAGGVQRIGLYPRSVADFYEELMRTLEMMGYPVEIWPVPVELPDPIPFASDTEHAAYDAEFVQRFWRLLLQIEQVFRQFQGGFVGKSSPVQFYWGSFDLCLIRFSGRPAPPHPSGIPFVVEASSHEQFVVGFWPGSGAMQAPAFYAYAYPEPEGLRAARIAPGGAAWHAEMQEFILPYEAIRSLDQPEQALLDFCQSTYAAAAELGHWDRAALERPFPP
jgi:hypothetical protein